jgi:GH35 family endo-1,4-beta-xylanase
MNKHFVGIAFIAFLYMCNSLSVFAQPTDKQVKKEVEAATKTSNKTTEVLTEDKAAIENEYLAKARHNIEAYRKSDAVLVFVDAKNNPLENIKVEINQVSQDFRFGNLAFEMVNESDNLYKADLFRERFKTLFNFAIFPFYWAAYESSPGKPQWQRNQAVLEWCLANGITCKGHPLGWTGQYGTPRWLIDLPEQTATDLYKARIYNNVIGYKGKIDVWDVVNEPVNTIPWEDALNDKSNNDGIRYNVDKYTTGQFAPWIEKSYKWAYDANPEGHYILNEYFTLAIPEVRDRFYELLKELKKRNTPIGGIGIQAHEPREMWFSPVEMNKTFDLYSEFNLPIHITEFIPQSAGKDITGWRTGKWTEETQAEFAEQFYTLAFGHPSIASITWWGLSDRKIWLEGGGLIDKEYNPKPVYTRLMKLIKEDWMTKNVIVSTDSKGKATFRGFFGNYKVVVTKPNGDKQTLNVHLTEKGTNYWKFDL